MMYMEQDGMYLWNSCDKCSTEKTKDDRPTRHQRMMRLIATGLVELPNVVHTAFAHMHPHLPHTLPSGVA